MTTQKDRAKQKKKRAQKHKHEHETEHMQEEAARHKRSSREEWVAIIVILAFVPFLVTGIIWWPGSTTPKSKGGTGLASGTYSATYIGSQPETETEVATAALDVNGYSIFVTADDLTGSASRNSNTFFKGQKGQPVQITVQNGFITNFTSTPPPK